MLNPAKTNYTLFSRSKDKHHRKCTIYTMDGFEIQKVQYYKYFGIWLDEDLSFKTHVEELVKTFKYKMGFSKGTKTSRLEVVQEAFFVCLGLCVYNLFPCVCQYPETT